MADLEKVIKGLEIHLQPNSRCIGCPYPNNGLCGDQLYRDALSLLKAQPEIVRCKDCKWRGTYQCPIYIGGDGMCGRPDEWFCADGERDG